MWRNALNQGKNRLWVSRVQNVFLFFSQDFALIILMINGDQFFTQAIKGSSLF